MPSLESLPLELWDLILNHIILAPSVELSGLGGELINLHQIAGLASTSKTLQHSVWSFFARKPFKPLIPGWSSFAHYLADRAFGDSVVPFSIAIGILLRPRSPADHPTLHNSVATELFQIMVKALLFSRARKVEAQNPCFTPPTGPWDYSLEPMSRKVAEFAPSWVEVVLVVKCQIVAFYLDPGWFETGAWRELHQELVHMKMQKIVAAITYRTTLGQFGQRGVREALSERERFGHERRVGVQNHDERGRLIASSSCYNIH
ncbi:hypothetical protein N7454_004717 [Penicillium verhagenii]|nr:hypothetical protein N7454_004717 [Penicillium verhagenii]